MILGFLNGASNMVILLMLLMAASLIGFWFVWNKIKIIYDKDKRIRALFGFAVAISVSIIFFQFIIGRGYYVYRDIGSDTYIQYYPYFVNVAHRIKTGTFSIWNWSFGLGKSLANTVGWSFDPFSTLVILCGVLVSERLIMYMLVWMQILKIVIIYIISVKLFKLYSDNETAVYLGAYLHAFNGYLMLWGQHYFLGTACVYNILIIYLLEKLIQKKGKFSGLGLSVVVALYLIFGYYTSYMTLLVAAGYFLLRYFEFYRLRDIGLKQLLKDFAAVLLYVVRGVLMACVILLPAIYHVTHISSRLNGANQGALAKMKEAFHLSFNLCDFGTRMTRLMSNNMLFINDNSKALFGNYYETPQLFISLFIFFFFGQWIVYSIKEKKALKERLFLLLKCVLMLLLLFNSVSGLILNAFAYPAYRYTFVVLVFLTLMVVKSWEYTSKNGFSIIGVIIGALLSYLTWIFAYKHMVYEVWWYLKIIFIIIAIGTFLQVAARLPKLKNFKEYMAYAFIVLVICTTCFDDCITTNQRIVVSDIFLYAEHMNNYLESSTMSALDWLKDYDDSFFRVEKDYIDWASLSDSLIDRYSSLTWYDTIVNSKTLDFYTYICTNSETGVPPIKYFHFDTDVDEMAMRLVNTRYMLSKNGIKDSDFKLINTIDDVKIYENTGTQSVAKWYTKTISKGEFAALSQEDRLLILEDTLVTDDVVLYYDDADCTIGDFKLVKQTVLEGEVDCDGPGILMIAVPDEDGWQAYVDGKKVDYINADYGFIGIELTPGVKKISLRYSLPCLKQGFILSLIGIFSCLGEIFYLFFRKSKSYKE